jgi:hypothetical protein
MYGTLTSGKREVIQNSPKAKHTQAEEKPEN